MRVETKMRPLSQSSAWMLCEPSSKNTTSAGCWHEMAATDHMSIRPCTSHVTDCRELQKTRHKAPHLNNYCKKLKKLSRCCTNLVLLRHLTSSSFFSTCHIGVSNLWQGKAALLIMTSAVSITGLWHCQSKPLQHQWGIQCNACSLRSRSQ